MDKISNIYIEVRHSNYMDVGIKVWSSNGFEQIQKVSEICDFVEIIPIKKKHIPKLKDLQTRWNVHAKHKGVGMNLADKTLEKKNLKLMEEAIYTANELNAKVIVTHAGNLVNKNCSQEQSLKILEKINDDRIVIENLCFESSLNQTPTTIKQFTKISKKSICFDFSHAQMVAARSNITWEKFLNDFIKLKPVYFHICDGNMGEAKDMHLNLGKGDFDLKNFKKLIGKKPVALEVDVKSSMGEFQEQVKFLKA